MVSVELNQLKPGAKIYLMGICGTAMSSLAGLLKEKGFIVSGSDSNPYPPMSTQLERLNIPIKTPYSAKNLNPKPDFVIVGNVISATNPEVEELNRQKIPYTSLPKALGEWIIGTKSCICVSGTHGKTTTTSLLSWVLERAGKDPGFLIGGIPKNFQNSFKNSNSDFFAIEGDEYDTAFFDKVPKFIHYRPKHVILTSIEFDHADIYKDLEDVKKAFSRLMKLIPTNGSLVYWSEDKNISDLLEYTNTKNLFSYGFNNKNSPYHAQVKIVEQNSEGTVFKVNFQKEELGPFQTSMSGEYNLLNATAVIVMAKNLGIDLTIITEALQKFQGVKRRQEILGEPEGRLIIEDFAHHPTAVLETLRGIKMRYPQRKIFAVFEPRSATSRRKFFQKDYVQSFKAADVVYIMQAFDQSKIEEGDRFSVDELIIDLNKLKNSTWAYAHHQVEQIVSNLKQQSKTGDLIIIMSNGGFDNIYSKLLAAFSNL